MTTLGISSGRFTLNGAQTFLLGVSYFDGLNWRQADLDRLASQRINCIRVFVDWANDLYAGARSIFNANGTLKTTEKNTILNLVRAADAKGIVVEMVILADGSQLWMTNDSDRKAALQNCVAFYAGEPNVFFDVCNEYDITPFVTTTAALGDHLAAARLGSSTAILGASGDALASGGQMTLSDVVDGTRVSAERTAGSQVIAHHDQRSENYVVKSELRAKALRDYLDANSGSGLPVYFSEPNRHGFSWASTPAEFAQAALGCKLGGGAGWIFHNGGCFDMSSTGLYGTLNATELATLEQIGQIVNDGYHSRPAALLDSGVGADEGPPFDYIATIWGGAGLSRISNQIGCTTAGGGSSAYGLKYHPNQYVKGTMAVVPRAGQAGSEYATIYGRAPSLLNTAGGGGGAGHLGDRYQLDLHESSGWVLKMRKQVAGVETQLGSSWVPITNPANGDTMTLILGSGYQLGLYNDLVVIMAYDMDSALLGAGYVGWETFLTAAGCVVRWTNLIGGALDPGKIARFDRSRFPKSLLVGA